MAEFSLSQRGCLKARGVQTPFLNAKGRPVASGPHPQHLVGRASRKATTLGPTGVNSGHRQRSAPQR